MIYDSILSLIGRTPIIRTKSLVPEGAELLVKLEWYNPGGSVKDRAALFMIERAETMGLLTREREIIEASSGNMGVSLAMICAIKGYKLTIVLPENASEEKKKIMRIFGANLVFSPASQGTSGAISLKQKIILENPQRYIDLDQFSNPANVEAHYYTTAQEIWDATKGKVDVVVIGIGTAGTGVGVSKKLKERRDIKVVGVIPNRGAAIKGLRNPYDTNPSRLFIRDFFDEIVEIDENAIPDIKNTAILAARKEGLFVGMSAAAILYVAVNRAQKLPSEKTVVAILPDSGRDYLSDFYNEI